MNQLKPLLLLIHFLFVTSFLLAQPPLPAFANRYGGSGSDYNYGIRTQPDGSSVFVGIFVGSVTLGTNTYSCLGGSDAFVCKTNPNGEVLWSKTLAGAGNEILSQLWLDDQGSVYVAGEYNSTVDFAGTTISHVADKEGFVAKLSSDGDLLWTKQVTNAGEADFNEIAVDGSGNVFAFGTFTGSISIGGFDLTAQGTTGSDLLLVKYNSQGDVVWAKRYGNSPSENALALWVNPQGECTLVGDFLGVVTFGQTTVNSNGSSDIFITRLNSDGDPVVVRTYGGPQTDNAFGITGDAEGNVFVTGTFMQTLLMGNTSLTSNGAWDVFVAKFSPTIDVVWAVGYGGSANDRANDVALDHNGNVYSFGWYQNTMVVGPSTLTSMGEYDVFLLKLQPDGSPVWASSFGGSSFDVGAAMAFDAAGNFHLSGDFWSANFSVGSLNLAPVSGNDIFVIKLGNTPLGIEIPAEKQTSFLQIRHTNGGWLQVESKTSGRLHAVNTIGQILFDGLIQAEVPVSIPRIGKLVLYRFQSDGKAENGKWVAN